MSDKYLILLAADEGDWGSATAEERQRVMDAHDAFHKAVADRATMVAGEALADPEAATTLRRVDGRPVLTEGPFAETAEVVGGFYLVDAPDLDVMTSLCELLPAPYTLEIRPVVQIEGFEST